MSDYTPTTEEVSNTDSAKPWTPTTQYVVERYADDWQGGTTSERVAQFDRWLAEVKAQEAKAERERIKQRLWDDGYLYEMERDHVWALIEGETE